MSKNIRVEFAVGLFIISSVCALFFLAFYVSGVSSIAGGSYYTVRASFDNVGDLKQAAPVTLSGVKVGEVESITLDPTTLQATVLLRIMSRFHKIPVDSSASILTQGLLGSNYIGLTPGFENENLANKSEIQTTHSALILENIIGQLVYSLKDSGHKKDGHDTSE